MRKNETQIARLIDFDMAMRFQSPEVVWHIVRRHFLPIVDSELELAEAEVDAEWLFGDVKRFLFLCAYYDAPLAPPGAIEEAWVCFMDYPQMYTRFSEQYLGYYVPMYPAPDIHIETAYELWERIEETRLLAAQAYPTHSLSHNWFNFSLIDAP